MERWHHKGNKVRSNLLKFTDYRPQDRAWLLVSEVTELALSHCPLTYSSLRVGQGQVNDLGWSSVTSCILKQIGTVLSPQFEFAVHTKKILHTLPVLQHQVQISNATVTSSHQLASSAATSLARPRSVSWTVHEVPFARVFEIKSNLSWINSYANS